MRRSVPSVLRERPPKDGELNIWAQEVIPAVRELQTLRNREYEAVFEYTTTNTAAFETAWTSDDMPGDGNWRITVEAQAIADDGSAGYYWLLANYKRVSSAAPAAVGSVRSVVTANEDVAGWDVQFSTSSNAIVFQVKGDATRVVDWTLTVRITQVV